MIRRNISRLMVMLLCLGAFLGALGAGNAYASPLGDHLPQTKDPSSARFEISGSINTSGGAIPISGTGAVSGTDAMLDMMLTAPAGASGPEELTLSAIIVGDKLYFKMSGLSTETDDTWYVTDFSGATGMGGMMTGIDMQAAHDAITITGTSKETLHGVATTRYNMEVDTAAMAPTGQNPMPEGATFDTTVTMSLWVGDQDMYVHQLMMQMESVATVGETTSFVRVDLTMTFSAFDTPITITPPADAEPLSLDLGSALPGIPVGGVLGMPGMTTGMGTGMPRTGAGDTGAQWPIVISLLALGALAGGVTLRRRSALAER